MPKFGSVERFSFYSSYKEEPEYINSVMTFAQATAPLGWVRVSRPTDNSTLRITSGTPSQYTTYGNVAVSDVYTNLYGYNSTIWGPWPISLSTHFITTAEMEAHNHAQPVSFAYSISSGSGPQPATPWITSISPSSYNTGAVLSPNPYLGAGHSHSGSVDYFTITSGAVNMAVKYMDVILAKY